MKARNHFRFPQKISQTEINDNKAIIPSLISNCIGIQEGFPSLLTINQNGKPYTP